MGPGSIAGPLAATMHSKCWLAVIWARFALALEEDVWPSCLLQGMTFRTLNPIYADVRPYINHPDKVRHRTITYSSDEQVGMALRDQPHDLGELVLDVVPGGQAEKAGVRKGWIIKEINGKPFSSTERLNNIADDFGKARTSGSSLVVKYDVQTYFDCWNATCTKSDRFPTESMPRCAEACQVIPECQWWAYGPLDTDNMCQLQGKSTGFVQNFATVLGAKKCSPKATWGLASSWPKCVMKNTHIYGEAGAAFADVRPLIARSDESRHRMVTFTSDGDFGLILRDKPAATGEVVDEVTKPSQAWTAGVRKGWIIVEVSGKSFRKGDGVDDAESALKALKGTAPALIVKFDVKSSMDCTNGDCSRSDKLPAATEAECAAHCSKILTCQWWTFGVEEEDKMCWLRTGANPAKALEGSSAGDRACVPESSGKWFRIFSLVLVGIAVVKYREQLMMAFAGVSGAVGKRGATKNGRFGVPGLEMTKDCGLDDDDDNETFSLIGRSRKRSSGPDPHLDFSL